MREARLRAGLWQEELAKVSGKDRTVIARYEQGVVAPSLDTLVQMLRSCGFDILLELVPYDAGRSERIEEIQGCRSGGWIGCWRAAAGFEKRTDVGRTAEAGMADEEGSIRAGCWRRCIATGSATC